MNENEREDENEGKGKERVQSQATPRDPHYRRYQLADGQSVLFYVDSIGVVQVTEELLNTMLTQMGYTEVDVV